MLLWLFDGKIFFNFLQKKTAKYWAAVLYIWLHYVVSQGRLRSFCLIWSQTETVLPNMNTWGWVLAGAERSSLRQILINVTDAVTLNDSPTLQPLRGVTPPIEATMD